MIIANYSHRSLIIRSIPTFLAKTDIRDNCIYIGKKYVTVFQDKNAKNPFKLGFNLNAGNAYYVLGEEILCKKYETNHKNGVYPDGGCSFETYCCAQMIEFETLGQLKVLEDGQTSEHIEHWSLCKKPCFVDFKDDNSIDNFLSNI